MQKIEVFREYEGNRCKHKIVEGVYDFGDEHLVGLEIFLRDNGNAKFIEVEIEQPKPVKPVKRKGSK